MGEITIKNIVHVATIDLFFAYQRLDVRGYKVKENNRCKVNLTQ